MMHFPSQHAWIDPAKVIALHIDYTVAATGKHCVAVWTASPIKIQLLLTQEELDALVAAVVPQATVFDGFVVPTYPLPGEVMCSAEVTP